MTPTSPAQPARPARAVDLDALLTALPRRVAARSLLARRGRVAVLLRTEADSWTVAVDGTGVRARRGSPEGRATTTITASARVLVQVLEGRRSGASAFLAGELAVRGDLGVALAVSDLVVSPERPVTHPRVRSVLVRGLETTYLEAGDPRDPPVVVLHGLGATSASMLPVLEALAPDHRVLAPDLPGHGDTAGARALGGAYSPGWTAAWLEVFQRETGSRPAVLVGNSLGGRIAIEAGLQDPRGVASLVLLSPSPAFRRLRQAAPLVRLLRPQSAVLPLRPPHVVVTEYVKAMVSDPARLPPGMAEAAADEFLRVARNRRSRVAFAAYARGIYLEQAHGERGFWTRLPSLTRPATFVWGERDRLVPAGFARHVVAALPQSSSIVLPDCGHVPHLEWPERTAEVIRTHLGEHPAG